jgi:CRP-like cAMP-binding protein/DNA-binding NarL/FixJ family response regulator
VALKILIVEDEGIVSLDLEDSLQSSGYLVTDAVDSGEAALASIQRVRPDIVLMDITLRGAMDGIEAASIIREQYGIPLIYMTAHADEATLRRAKVTTPYGYILKPIRDSELKAMIEIAHSRYEAEQSSSTTRENSTESIFPNEAPEPELSEAFTRNAILKEFAPALQSQLLAVSTSRLYTAGHYLVHEDMSVESVPVLLSGSLELLKISSNGKELIIDLLSPNEDYLLSLLLSKTAFPFTIRAHSDVHILQLPLSKVLPELLSSASALRACLREISGRLEMTINLARSLAHDRVEPRIASILLALGRKAVAQEHRSVSIDLNKTYTLDLSRKELADLVGITPETASRVSKALEREGILDLGQAGLIIVQQPKALLAIIQDS